MDIFPLRPSLQFLVFENHFQRSGTNPYDAGMFYCPYVPLQMVKAVGENDFQPRIGFKTRYGMVANPFVTDNPTSDIDTTKGLNQYYRIFRVDNILDKA